MPFDPHAQGRALFDRATLWEAAGIEPRDIFHAYAQAFGHALSRYCDGPTAVAFLEQELKRVRAVSAAARSGSGRLQ